MFRKIYIQLICIAKTRNGKLVALALKQPLQEKLDIDSEESDLHALNIICDTDQENDDFCVDFMDEEEKRFPSLGEKMLTIKLFGIYIVMKICVPIPFFFLLVSHDMGIRNKKTTLIKINNYEKGFIQVKETIQASHQQ
jgi:hypothetical protein